MLDRNLKDLTQEIVQQVSRNYNQIFDFFPKRTKLNLYLRGEWQDFCERFDHPLKSEGIFLPRNLSAHLLADSPFLELNIFHEYFGHGLFCEYNKQGKFLQKLEQRLVKDERRQFKRKKFSKKELREFREKNPNFKLLKKESDNNPYLYETFAVWTEHYLSERLRLKNKFSQKYKEMPKEIQRNLEKMLSFQRNYGELALFYEIGMPKYYNAEKIKNLLERMFKDKEDKFKDARLGLLYGSRKPYSDIDLFVVSDKVKDFTNEWLDIYALRPKQFEYASSVFDVSIADPLLTGELVFGDKKYFEQKRKQLKEQPITQEAIYYNIIKSKEQKNLSYSFPKNSKEYLKGISYTETYMKNALALRQGKRKLTKKSLVS